LRGSIENTRVGDTLTALEPTVVELMSELGQYTLLALAAFGAGAINAVAGGGTLLTFPALLGIGVPPTIANATSTIALLPGSLASAWAYRKELRTVRRVAMKLLPVSLMGGTLGALLLVWYPNEFKALVPWLILTAAVLFLVQPLVSGYLKKQQSSGEVGATMTLGVVAFQLFVAIYGGYFGAGIGILMLAALGFLHIGDIHHMNAVKTLLASSINLVSIAVFLWEKLVWWNYASVMIVAGLCGGYLGARVARKLPAASVRYAVVVIGFVLAAYFFATRSA
jgi:uncharacterized protein